jgi:hypothetical protein
MYSIRSSLAFLSGSVDPLNVTIRDEPYMLSPGTPVAIELPPR